MEDVEIGYYKPEQGQFVEQLSLATKYLEKVRGKLLKKVKAYLKVLQKPLHDIDKNLVQPENQQILVAHFVHLEFLADDQFAKVVFEVYRKKTEALQSVELCRVALANYTVHNFWPEISDC